MRSVSTSTADRPGWNRRIVALANNKGGVKKTSTTVNVAGQLAAGGFKVLVVALDTQRESRRLILATSTVAIMARRWPQP